MFFVGRTEEQEILKKIFEKKEASIVIIYGRRRVGKTALIEHCLKKKRYLKIEGKQGQNKKNQIQHSLYTLAHFFKEPSLTKLNFTSWTEVFDLIASKTKKGAWTLYLEEVQWLAQYEDELISDLKVVWDNSFKKNPHFRLILCGSAPSFMLTHVVKSKALYNRSQYSIPLTEFSPNEVSAFFKNKKTKMEVMDAILSTGGIPEYLKYLEDESSVYLSLCKHSFSKGGFFTDEYEKIFTSSLSENPHYKKLIEFLALKKFANRTEILKFLDIDSGGSISNVFEDLVQCHLIEEIIPYFSETKKRLVRYAITDAYLQFYFKFIKPKEKKIRDGSIRNYQTALPIANYRQWLGYAFERWCRRNHHLIARALGFEDVEYQSGAYFQREHLNSDYQIDLLFQRKDRVISVCEIKYNQTPITSSIINEFESKLTKLKVKNGYTIQRVLIAAGGCNENLHQTFDRILTINDLF